MSHHRPWRILLIPILICTSLTPAASARPYGVSFWNQTQDFRFEFGSRPTDLFAQYLDGTIAARMNYNQLVVAGAAEQVFRGSNAGVTADCSPINVVDRHYLGLAPGQAPPVGWKPFTIADYNAIVTGAWHCAPTSFAMIDNYWHANSLDEVSTIVRWARAMDTDDVNPAMNANDHLLSYGSAPTDQRDAVPQFGPARPWGPGPYAVDARGWNGAAIAPGPAGPNLAYPSAAIAPILGELRAGRPFKVGNGVHATTAVDFSAAGLIVNDPAAPAAPATVRWAPVAPAPGVPGARGILNTIFVQPQRIPDERPGTRLYFSNDFFGTGQANAQAPGGDAGDIFGSNLNGRYGLAADDVTMRLVASTGNNPDYNHYQNGRISVTSGRELPFNIDDFDCEIGVMPVKKVLYSKDDGHPNPHTWFVGNPGDPVLQNNDVQSRVVSTNWFTSGFRPVQLRDISAATEDDLGLNRWEDKLGPGQLLDDDVDGLEVEFDEARLSFSVDFVDTRLFPDYLAANPGAAVAGHANFAMPPGGLSPVNVYRRGSGGPELDVDGVAQVCLDALSDIDAVQFISFSRSGVRNALLFSVDADAPTHRTLPEAACGNAMELDPGTIYLSRLNHTRPEPWLALGGDVDAITILPEPQTIGLLAAGLALLWRSRQREARRDR